MAQVPEDVLVVFDEAYYEYVTRSDYPQTLPYVMEERNFIITRTFSKIYGLAGARVWIRNSETLSNRNDESCPSTL